MESRSSLRSRENVACEVEQVVETPLGPMRLAATSDGLAAAWFYPEGEVPRSTSHGDAPALAVAAAALQRYFDGDGTTGDLPPLDLRGTELQREVWDALLRIPVGVTRTYRDIAEAVGRPNAMRAVGAAIGANPVGVLVPCHRVIGSDGSLTGYAGGLERKRWLLAHEGALLPL